MSVPQTTNNDFICIDCGSSRCRGIPENHEPTWHEGICAICEAYTAVTQVRDFGGIYA